MARDAHRIPAFDVMARGARLHVAPREHGMLAAAAAFAETNKVRRTVRHRKRRGKTGVLITRVAIGAERLLVVAGKTIRLLRAQIHRVREHKIQLMHAGFDPNRPAAHRRPILGNAAITRAARELRGDVGMTGLAKIFRMANRAVIRYALDSNQPFVLFRPIRLLMRNRQQRLGLRVAGFAGVGDFDVVVAGVATRHHRQKRNGRFLGIFNAGVARRTFELVGLDVLFVAETNFTFGRGKGFVLILLRVAIHAIAFDFSAVAFAALLVLGEHQIVRVLARLRRGVARAALRAGFANVFFVRKFDGCPLLDGIVP